MKLINRKVPRELLIVLEKWFTSCYSCVKWETVFSAFYKLDTGVRQGGVLSPHLFCIYIDDVVKRVKSLSLGCNISHVCTSIILYADDLILLAPTVHALQRLLNACEQELNYLDMIINPKKSVCMRIGPRFDIM